MKKVLESLRDKIGVYGLLIILYVTVLSTGYGVFHLNSLKYFCFIISSVVIFLLFLGLSGKKELSFRPASLLFLFFWGVSSLSLLWPGVRYDPRIYAAVSFGTFLFLILIENGFRSGEQLRILLKGVVLLVIVQLLLGILEGTGQVVFYGVSHGVRVITTLGNPNYLAGVLILLLPLTAAGGVSALVPASGDPPAGRGLLIRRALFWWLPFLGGMVLLVLTQCRAAWVGFAFAALCFFGGLLFLGDKKGRKKLLLLILILIGTAAVIVVLLMLLLPSLKNRILGTFSQIFSGDSMGLLGTRYIAWDTAVKMWIENSRTFFLGQGSGGYYANHFVNLNPDFGVISGGASYKHTHNEYLEILADGGILSLLAWLGLVGWALVRNIRSLRNVAAARFNRVLALSLFCGILAMLIHTFFSLVMRTMVVNMCFYLLIGLSEVNGRLAARGVPVSGETPTSRRWLFNTRIPLPTGLRRLILLLPLAALLSFPAVTGFRYVLAEYAIQQGYRAVSSEDSELWFKRSLEWNPRNIYALYELMWLTGSEPEVSLEYAEQIESLVPAYRKSAWVTGVNHYLLGNYTEAHENLERYRLLNRFDAKTYIFLLHIHIREGNQLQTEETLRNMIIVRDKYLMSHRGNYVGLEEGVLQFTQAGKEIRVSREGETLVREVGSGYLSMVAALLMDFQEAPLEVLNARINLTTGSLYDELAYGDAGASFYMEAFMKGAVTEGEREFIYNKIFGYYQAAEELLTVIQTSGDPGIYTESGLRNKLIGFLGDLLSIQPDKVFEARLIELKEEL